MTKDETIEALREDLYAVEHDEEPPHFAAGHGIMSRFWRFEWNEPWLSIDFELPYGRVLADDDDQTADAALLAAAIRMALLLLAAPSHEREHLVVTHDGQTAHWATLDENGETLDEADDWSGLVTRFEAHMPEERTTIIWP